MNGYKDRRFRIEHAQQIRPEDLPRFGESLNLSNHLRFSKNDIIASMQPYHAIDDGQWAEKILGSDRINEMYPFKSFLENKTLYTSFIFSKELG